jgi:formate dehydrogenase major subunit
MAEITLTINDKPVKGKDGDSVLDVCRANGIDLPTLCHMDGLSDVGACRMCLVEIERERRPVPACTYPARSGLVVQTATEKLERYRRQVLELLFAAKNHNCPYCVASGQCELQALGYRYKMDHVRYAYANQSLKMDASNKYWALDHNRCILCGRCVRACNEIAANHSLGFGHRGFKELVALDLNSPIAGSTCQNYGACVQACPTGAIFDKFSMYKARRDECQVTDSVCPSCGVACEIKVFTKDNNLVKIEAPDPAGNPRGSLCRMGRFDLVAPKEGRITSPMVRDEGKGLRHCTLEEAVGVVARRLGGRGDSFSGLVSGQFPIEILKAFKKFMNESVDSRIIETIDGGSARPIMEGIYRFEMGAGCRGLDVECIDTDVEGTGQFQQALHGLNIECPIEEISGARTIMVIGANPDVTHPVVSALIRRAVDQTQTRVVVINSSEDGILPYWTKVALKPKPGTEGLLLNGMAAMLAERTLPAQGKVSTGIRTSLCKYDIAEVARVTGIEREKLEEVLGLYCDGPAVIVYGEDILKADNSEPVTAIMNLAFISGNRTGDRLRVISLKARANSRGAWELGLANGSSEKTKGLYLLLSDKHVGDYVISTAKAADFVVLQANYESAITDMADVIFPSPTWSERAGQFVSMDGRVLQASRATVSPEGVVPDEKIFEMISSKIGRNPV